VRRARFSPLLGQRLASKASNSLPEHQNGVTSAFPHPTKEFVHEKIFSTCFIAVTRGLCEELMGARTAASRRTKLVAGHQFVADDGSRPGVDRCLKHKSGSEFQPAGK
jgi:hypothetical protein